jgi:hypothetical protein
MSGLRKAGKVDVEGQGAIQLVQPKYGRSFDATPPDLRAIG